MEKMNVELCTKLQLLKQKIVLKDDDKHKDTEKIISNHIEVGVRGQKKTKSLYIHNIVK
jgi:hypothetical protein